MNRFVVSADAVPPGEGRAVHVGGAEIALFHCASGWRAVSNACPHAGGPLSDGIVAGDTVTCPLHGRVVDLRSGAVSDCDGAVTVYAVHAGERSVTVEVHAD